MVLASLGVRVSAQTLAGYQATILSQSPSAYFKLDANLTDSVSGSLTLTTNGASGGFMPDAFRNTTSAYGFLNSADGLTAPSDIIGGGDVATNAAATGVGSISLVFRALDSVTVGGQRFVLSQGNTTTNGNALSLFFENNTSSSDQCALKLRVGDGTTAILASNAIAFNSWYYFAMTYDETRDAGEVKWYLGQVGGALNSGTIDMGNDAVVGDNGAVYLGNQSTLGSGYRSPGRGRVDEFAVWTNELSGTQISNQFSKLPSPIPAAASYQDVVSAHGPAYYFKLDGSLLESMGGVLALSTNGPSGAFTNDLLGNPNGAYSFTETNDALFITHDLINGGGPGIDTVASGVGTINFLFRMLSDTNNGGQRYLFSAPASTTNGNQLGLFLESSSTANGNPNSLKLRVGNTTKGNVGSTDPVPVAYPEDLVPNAWYYFAMTYDESRNTPEVFVYFGRVGATLSSTSFNPANNSVVGDNGTLWIGNRDTLTSGFRSPGQGAIDEFATYNDELSPSEIAAQFNAILNVAAAPPSLAIALAGTNVLLSWTINNTAAYHLESANSLSPATWVTNTSPVTVIGANNVVTNAASSGQQYFRLK
jgi:hypothetical protein